MNGRIQRNQTKYSICFRDANLTYYERSEGTVLTQTGTPDCERTWFVKRWCIQGDKQYWRYRYCLYYRSDRHSVWWLPGEKTKEKLARYCM